MNIKTEKNLSIFVTVVLMWLNGFLVTIIADIKYSNFLKIGFNLENIIWALLYGYVLTVFTVQIGIYFLVKKYFGLKDYELDFKIPNLKIWTSLMMTYILFVILLIKWIYIH